MQNQTAYRQILRAASVFGGVQVFNIIISVVRSKAITLLIGPAGMGVAGLLTAAVSLIAGCTNLGLETSAVKFISEKAESDREEIPMIVSVLRRAAWITGIAGALLTIALAPLLSRLTFGSDDFAWSFVFLSAVMVLKQVSVANLAVLQGFRRFSELARANFYGSLFGLVISIPLYYVYRFDAIVPAMIVSALTACLASVYFGRREKISNVQIPRRQLFAEGKAMLKLGMMLSFSGMAAAASIYLIQVFVAREGGLEQAGFYNAGFLLLNSYVGLVFSAMATEYLPRLSAVSSDNAKVSQEASLQAISALLLLTPVICLFMAFAPTIVSLLFSGEFLVAVPMVIFGMTGMLFRSVSWSIGFILIAKADSAMFIKTAFGFNLLFVALHIAGYHFGGLTGLGAAFAIHYFLHFAILYLIARKRYAFKFSAGFANVFFISALLTVISFLSTFIPEELPQQAVLIVIFLVSMVYSVREVKARSGIKFGKFNRK